MPIVQTRRHFLASARWPPAPRALSALVDPRRRGAAGDDARFGCVEDLPGICVAPRYIAEDLLRAEGFTDISYVAVPARRLSGGMHGARSISLMNFVAPVLVPMDAGDPITVLAGVHRRVLRAVRATSTSGRITDLKGKSVGVQALGSSQHIFLASMAAHVGLDPARTSTGSRVRRPKPWSSSPRARSMPSWLSARAPGTAGQQNRSRDRQQGARPALVAVLLLHGGGNTDFVREHPVATKRAMRAILKAADLCAADPERAAQRLVDGGFTQRYDYALQTLTDLPYDRWREYDPEDTMRFYALRLHEVGMIESSPNKLIADGTDWRFLNELKRELKA